MIKDAGCPLNRALSLNPLCLQVCAHFSRCCSNHGLLKLHSRLKPQEVAGFLPEVAEAADGYPVLDSTLQPAAKDGSGPGEMAQWV